MRTTPCARCARRTSFGRALRTLDAELASSGVALGVRIGRRDGRGGRRRRPARDDARDRRCRQRRRPTRAGGRGGRGPARTGHARARPPGRRRGVARAARLKGKTGPVRAYRLTSVTAGVAGREPPRRRADRRPRARARRAPRGVRSRRRRSDRPAVHRVRDRPASARAAWSREFVAGVGADGDRSSSAAACRTARASPTGRWPRSFRAGAGIADDRRRRWSPAPGSTRLPRRPGRPPDRPPDRPGARAGREPASPGRPLLGGPEFLEALAGTRPLVVVLEDVHWAEPTLLDLIDDIVERSRGASILLVARPGRTSSSVVPRGAPAVPEGVARPRRAVGRGVPAACLRCCRGAACPTALRTGSRRRPRGIRSSPRSSWGCSSTTARCVPSGGNGPRGRLERLADPADDHRPPERSSRSPRARRSRRRRAGLGHRPGLRSGAVLELSPEPSGPGPDRLAPLARKEPGPRRRSLGRRRDVPVPAHPDPRRRLRRPCRRRSRADLHERLRRLDRARRPAIGSARSRRSSGTTSRRPTATMRTSGRSASTATRSPGARLDTWPRRPARRWRGATRGRPPTCSPAPLPCSRRTTWCAGRCSSTWDGPARGRRTGPGGRCPGRGRRSRADASGDRLLRRPRGRPGWLSYDSTHGRMAEAEREARDALALFEAAGDELGQARAWRLLSVIHWTDGRGAAAGPPMRGPCPRVAVRPAAASRRRRTAS